MASRKVIGQEWLSSCHPQFALSIKLIIQLMINSSPETADKIVEGLETLCGKEDISFGRQLKKVYTKEVILQ